MLRSASKQENTDAGREAPCRVLQQTGVLCCVCLCSRIRQQSSLNARILGSVHWWLPGWQALEWEQKNMSGRALVLQIGSETALSPFVGRVN